MSTDDDVRSVLAALSCYVGYTLPPQVAGAAEANALPVGGWVFPDDQPHPVNDAPPAGDLITFGQALRERATAAGLHLLVRGDSGWPAGTGCDALPCLWVRGNPQVADQLRRAVTVTGSAAPSEYGMYVAADITAGLLAAGWTAVTALQLGIDYTVTTALRTAGTLRPVLVSTAGLDGDLPYNYQRIAETAAPDGSLISPFPPGCRRSGARQAAVAWLLGTLTAATLIVEARRDDPVLRCAMAAVAAGRPVFAVPGHVQAAMSAGCHDWIASGAARLAFDSGSVVTALTAHTTPGQPAGFDSGELYRVAGTAEWDEGWWHAKDIPPFYVPASSHNEAAERAFEVLFTASRAGATLNAGVYAPDGTYHAVQVSTTD